MNSYNDLGTLKGHLDITGTGNDTYLLEILNAASRQIEMYCHRWFYVKSETRYFDGSQSPWFHEDILSITTFKVDQDGDATYESTLATTDYHLYPLNGFPYTYTKISSNSDYGGFAPGIRKGIEIVGDFGYGDGESASPYTTSGDATAEDVDASETTIDITLYSSFSAGQTVLIDSEQMYVTDATDDTTDYITITRGVNGTSAVTHDTSTTIYIYDYPEPIKQACLIQTMRWWNRRDSAFADVIVSELGAQTIYKGLDPDIKQILFDGGYRKRSL